jgi:hypothetical protein
MHYETGEVVTHRNARRGSVVGLSVCLVCRHSSTTLPGVKPRQGPISERLLVIDAHQLHEHIRDQDAEVLHIAHLIQIWHDLEIWVMGARSFGRRRGDLQNGAGCLGHCVLSN